MNAYNPSLDPGTAIAVLAAGRATRFGGGKLDADCAGRRIGRWVTDAVEAAGFTTRLIVSAPDRPEFTKELQGWRIVINSHGGEGISSSIRAAVRASEPCSRLVIALADMPMVESGHLRAMAVARGIVFTSYPDGKLGVPAAFPSHCYGRLLELRKGMGAGEVDWKDDVTVLMPHSAQSLRDVDTRNDLLAMDIQLSASMARLRQEGAGDG